jgi:hypothetical protein
VLYNLNGWQYTGFVIVVLRLLSLLPAVFMAHGWSRVSRFVSRGSRTRRRRPSVSKSSNLKRYSKRGVPKYYPCSFPPPFHRDFHSFARVSGSALTLVDFAHTGPSTRVFGAKRRARKSTDCTCTVRRLGYAVPHSSYLVPQVRMRRAGERRKRPLVVFENVSNGLFFIGQQTNGNQETGTQQLKNKWCRFDHQSLSNKSC